MRIRRPGKSLLDDPVWIDLLERYVRGETTAALAREYGVSVSAIAWQARNRGYRKMDRPDAVYRWHRPPPIVAVPDRMETLAFEDDPDDPEGSAARALSLAARASREGRLGDHAQLSQAARSILRTGRVRGLIGRPQPAPACVSADLSISGAGDDDPVLRPAQQAPQGAWSTWLFLGGRGAGKTLAGAMWLADQAEALGEGGRLALIGPTLHDAREVMIEGASGILGLARWGHPRWGGRRPMFEPSRRRLVFPNGAVAQVFSAEDPDSLRGPQFAAAWADEFCAWRRGGETLALLRMGLRLPRAAAGCANAPLAPVGGVSADGREADAETDRGGIQGRPQLCVTTTPRPTVALRSLRAEPGCVETHAGTRDNADHLAPGFVEGLEALYGGTRRAAQEIDGRVVEVEGGLFTAEMLALAREPSAGGDRPCERILVGVDPTTTAGGDACGIVVAGRRRGADGRSQTVVLADRSARGLSPEGWARRAMEAARAFGAAAIVAEVNQGGEMVRSVFRAVGCDTPLIMVRAAMGKRARAEPVAALYEQGRVTHAGTFEALEEELMAVGSEDEGRFSLDRADALVWAITALMLKGGDGPRIRSLDDGYVPSGLSGFGRVEPGRRG